MKNNKGVSLISLVITIILILIIASISIYYGVTKNIDNTTETVSYNEIMDVEEAISQRSLMNKLNSSTYPLVGTPLTDSDPLVISETSYGDGWYKLEESDFSKLSLENVKKSYIVNYKDNLVVSTSPIVYNGVFYYNSEDIRNAISGTTSSISSNMYDSNKKVNRPILVKGMVPVKNIDGNWVATNADDQEWYDYSSQNKVWANVMLMDELSVSGYTNEQVRSASISELQGKIVTSSGSMLVWIPRYTVNSNGDIVYSNLLNDYTENGFSIPDPFKNNSSNSTGIWISKFDVEYK